jgi:hypothetical protein
MKYDERKLGLFLLIIVLIKGLIFAFKTPLSVMEKTPTSQLFTPSLYFINPTIHDAFSFRFLLKLQDLLTHFGSFLSFPLHRLINLFLLIGILLLIYETLLSIPTKLITTFTFVLLLLHPNFATHNISNLEELYFTFCFSFLVFTLTKIFTFGFQRNFLIFLALSFLLFPPWYRFFTFLPISGLLLFFYLYETRADKGLEKGIVFLSGIGILFIIVQPALNEIFNLIPNHLKIKPLPPLKNFSISFLFTLWSTSFHRWEQFFIRFIWSLSVIGLCLLAIRRIKEREIIPNIFFKKNLPIISIIGGSWLLLLVVTNLNFLLFFPRYLYPFIAFSQSLLYWGLIVLILTFLLNLNFQKSKNDIFIKKSYLFLTFIILIVISPIIITPKFSTLPISAILASWGLKELIR